MIIICSIIVAIIVSLLLFALNQQVIPNKTDNRKCSTKVDIRNTSSVLSSQLSSDFVDQELRDYKIIGKWLVVGDDGYVIAMKDGQLWSTYYNKKDRSVGVLIPLLQRIEDGDTIIYSEQSFGGEYMIIRPKGLYLYGNNDLEPYVWPIDR